MSMHLKMKISSRKAKTRSRKAWRFSKQVRWCANAFQNGWWSVLSVVRGRKDPNSNYHTRRLTAGELHDAILAFQADVQQNDDSSEVCLPA